MPAAAQIAAELACLRDMETKLLLVRDRPPERARAVVDKAVHRDAHRVDQHGFKLIAPERRTMIAMKFTIELDIGLSFLLQAALPQLVTDRETKTHRRGRSKRSYSHCRRRTEIPEAEHLASGLAATATAGMGRSEASQMGSPSGPSRIVGQAVPGRDGQPVGDQDGRTEDVLPPAQLPQERQGWGAHVLGAAWRFQVS